MYVCMYVRAILQLLLWKAHNRLLCNETLKEIPSIFLVDSEIASFQGDRN